MKSLHFREKILEFFFNMCIFDLKENYFFYL